MSNHRGKCNGKSCFICHPEKLDRMRERIVRLRAKGKSAEQISEDLGMEYQALLYAVRKYIPEVHKQLTHRGCPGPRCVLCSPKQQQRLKRYAKRGLTILSAAKKLKLTDVGLRLAIKKHFPQLLPLFSASGTKSRSESSKSRWRQYRATEKIPSARVREMLKLSKDGYGIDWIGKKLGCDGTTVRYNLIQQLGKKEYSKIHNSSRYCGGPKGYHKNDRGDLVQSSYEEVMADYLFRKHVTYDMHTTLKHKGKLYYPDFYLPEFDCYVEVLGMMKWDVYRKRVKVKKKAYVAKDLECYWLDTRDMVDGDVPKLFKKWLRRKRKSL